MFYAGRGNTGRQEQRDTCTQANGSEPDGKVDEQFTGGGVHGPLEHDVLPHEY